MDGVWRYDRLNAGSWRMSGENHLFHDTYSVEVPDSWTDHYGHMNEGYFVVAASDASWAFQAHLDIGTQYYDRTGCALVTVETHVRYLAEVSRGERLSFDSLVLWVGIPSASMSATSSGSVNGSAERSSACGSTSITTPAEPHRSRKLSRRDSPGLPGANIPIGPDAALP